MGKTQIFPEIKVVNVREKTEILPEISCFRTGKSVLTNEENS